MENACLVYLRPAYVSSMQRARARALRVRELYEFLEEALNDSLFWNVIFMARDINENESNVELMVS